MFNGFPTTMSPERQARWENFPGYGVAQPAPSYGTPEYVPMNAHGGSRIQSPMFTQPAPAPQPVDSISNGQPMNYATPVGNTPPGISPQPLVTQVAGGQPVDWQTMFTNMFGSRPQPQFTPTQVAPVPQQPNRIASFMANPAMQRFLPPQLLQAFAGGNQMPQFRRPMMAPGQPGLSNSMFRLAPAQNPAMVTLR